VLGTGDSDFTPLVHKLRELNRRVIGIGIEASTSALLPPACDEFLFYERLEGVEVAKPRRSSSRSSRARTTRPREEKAAETEEEQPAASRTEEKDLGVLVTQTLSGLERSTGRTVLASTLKKTILRKDPTFTETTYGFRGFVELLRNLEQQHIVELSAGPVHGDPEVGFPSDAGDQTAAFALLQSVVERLETKSGPPHLSGLKTQLRKVDSEFSEKRFGYGGFLQFCKAGRARGVIEMDWDADADDYIVRPVRPEP
jgi:hypothetical protein